MRTLGAIVVAGGAILAVAGFASYLKAWVDAHPGEWRESRPGALLHALTDFRWGWVAPRRLRRPFATFAVGFLTMLLGGWLLTSG